MNVSINGFGRIGRHVFKIAFSRKKFNIVAINDLTDAKTLAHLLKHDSTYGTWCKKITYDNNNLIVDGKKFPVLSEKNPELLPWKKMKVDVVLECTGIFRTSDEASKHITAGAKNVVISAPAKGGGVPTYVRGVNCTKVKKEKSKIINNASCTTNCIAPVMAILNEKFGIKKAMMTTVHGYTAGQNLQDGPHRDLRRARAAALNIVPTTTGAAKATGEVIPDVAGSFDGMSIRVPVPTVSLADITVVLKKRTTIKELNKSMVDASKTKRFANILATTEEELVSSDFVGNSYSSIVDLKMTNVVDGDLIKILAWYDNEVGYSNRLIEMAELFV